MELVPCPECGRVTTSDTAECPFCRFRLIPEEKPQPEPEPEPQPEPERVRERSFQLAIYIVTLLIFGMMAALVFLLYHFGIERGEPQTPEKAQTKTAIPQLEQPTGPQPPSPAPQPPQKEKELEETVPEPKEEEEETPEKPPKIEEKPALTLKEKKINALFLKAKKAYGRSDWKAAIESCEKLLDALGRDSEEAREIERLLHLAKAQLEVLNASGSSKAILKGLYWLAKHQDAGGGWDQDGFEKNCCPRKGDTCGGSGTGQYDIGVTGLALLAFLENGNTHHHGVFKETVKLGLDWLLAQQQEDGCLGARSGVVESWIYNHAIGTMALCQAFAITRDQKLKAPAQKAVDWILAAQNPGLGWKYEPRSGRNDTSVTGWMVMALKSAKTAGLKIDQAALDGAINWFDRATNTAGKCGYIRPGDPGSVIQKVNDHYAKLPTMTAVSVICRISCGQNKLEPRIQNGVDILMNNLPDWNKPSNLKIDMYYWYYATCAMFQFGGDKWQRWNKAMKDVLLDTQRQGGCADGSWDPLGKWGMVGGRIYSTAICTLTLQISQHDKLRPKVIVRPARARCIISRWGDSAYVQVTVTLKDGNSLTGIMTREGKDSITILVRDGISWEVERKEISEIKEKSTFSDDVVRIILKDGSSLTGTAASGEGHWLEIKVRDTLLWSVRRDEIAKVEKLKVPPAKHLHQKPEKKPGKTKEHQKELGIYPGASVKLVLKDGSSITGTIKSAGELWLGLMVRDTVLCAVRRDEIAKIKRLD